MGSPTSRSLKHLRDRGYKAFVVEKYNSFARIRIDFAGFADILAFRGDHPGVLAIQTTSDSNVSARLHKIADNENVRDWLMGGNRILVHGWGKKGPKGKRKLWELREIIYADSPSLPQPSGGIPAARVPSSLFPEMS